MSWWWAGAIGAAKKKLADPTVESTPSYQSVALIIGATGIVGSSLVDILPFPDTPGGPWKVYALSRRPLPLPLSSDDTTTAVTPIYCDISDHTATLANLSPLSDVTHIFYTSWARHPTELQNIESNSAMLRNVLSSLIPSALNLRHVCLLTGRKHYVGSFDSLGLVAPHDPPFEESLPRLQSPNIYYNLEDVLTEELLGGRNISWSIHRPTTIFGYSMRCQMNIVQSLCIYAAICRRERVPLRWPGSLLAWEGFSDASDADLVAEQMIWAAVDPYAKDEAFNCSNGDVFKWRQLWPVLAEQFGVEEWVGYEEGGLGLEEMMKGKEGVWEDMVRENELVVTTLEELGNWWFVDKVLGVEMEHLDSMNKSKEHGFCGFRNTINSFMSWIDKMKAYKIVPS